MTNWDETRRRWLPVVEQMAQAGRVTADIMTSTVDAVPITRYEELMQLGTVIDTYAAKLRRNRFEVVIVGLEKAGKSTVVNACLGVTLLPAAAERCTYTITRIVSAASVNDQEYAIEYYTSEELRRQLADAMAACERLGSSLGNTKYVEEVRELTELMPQLEQRIRAGTVRRGFTDLRDPQVLEELRSAIAQPEHARAIKMVTIRTVGLVRGDQDIVFSDVPGFDSPVEFHRRLALDQLADADAIVYCKHLEQPDLTESEIDILKRVADNDGVPLRDKTIVALTKADAAHDPAQFEELLAKATERWRRLAQVPAQRLVPVVALMKLFSLGVGDEDTMRIGPSVEARCVRLFGRSEGDLSGIDHLKSVLSEYIQTNRARVLDAKCAHLYHRWQALVDDIITPLRRQLPTPDGADDASDRAWVSERITAFWAGEWPRIRDEFIRYYYEHIRPRREPDDIPDLSPQLTAFRDAYCRAIDDFTDGLLDETGLKAIYAAGGVGRPGIVEPSEGHSAMRRHVVERAMSRLPGLVGAQVDHLSDVLGGMYARIRELLWDIPRLEAALEKPRMQEQLAYGMTALFLRFARPAVYLFLYYPRDRREKLLEVYGHEVSVLGENYIATPAQPDRQMDLDRFLRHGLSMIAAPNEQPGLAALDAFIRTQRAPEAHFTSALAEVREDVTFLGEYLKHSVFHAAGFVSFCHQEAEELRRTFEVAGQGYALYNLVSSAIYHKHPPLTRHLPDLDAAVAGRRELRKQLASLDTLLAGIGQEVVAQ